MPRKTQSIIVTVTDARLPNIDDLAGELAALGMKVDRVMPITGVISGTYASDDLGALKSIHGVHSVEEELTAEPLSATSFAG